VSPYESGDRDGRDILHITGRASDVCSTSQMFCQHPEYLAYAAGAVLVVAIGIKLGSAAN
jgi:hypothetical protein